MIVVVYVISLYFFKLVSSGGGVVVSAPTAVAGDRGSILVIPVGGLLWFVLYTCLSHSEINFAFNLHLNLFR